jgi:hypothetical protein
VARITSYELADRIAGDRIAVFKGRRADGVMVLMHQLTPGFDHSDVLKLGIAYMLRNPPGNGGLILDLVELDGLTYLVTADKPDCLELDGWLAREVGHAFAGEAEVTVELPPAARPPAAIKGASLVGFTPFLGSIQSTSGTLSPPQATRPAASRGSGPLLASPPLKPVGVKPVGPSATVSEPRARSQTPEPAAGPVSPATAPQPVPSTMPPAPAATDPLEAPVVPLPAFLGAPQTPLTPSAPEAPALYAIAQPKAGLGKTAVFTILGFLVVAVLFWLVTVLVPRVK